MSASKSKPDSTQWMPDHRDLELVIGLVAPVGTKLDVVVDILQDRLGVARYAVKQIHIAKDVIPLVEELHVDGGSPFQIAMGKMDAGNAARERSGDNAILALGAAARVFDTRELDEKGTHRTLGRAAHILRSIKHPEEVERLREVYPQGFYLIGVNADDRRRLRFLVDERRMSAEEAKTLMERDEDEQLHHGQKVADAFHMADFFVRLDENADRLSSNLKRIVDLIMGYPYHTPTFDEYAMFLAFAASLRSADLSRQVGAVIADEHHREVLATGANDCPRGGGGLYWPVERAGIIKDEPNGRDHVRGVDPNVAERNALIAEIGKHAKEHGIEEESVRKLLENSALRDITEYGRVVHAEMEALLSCARNRLSTRGRTLYGTTFPCHNCAKHIVAAGLERVVYVEPYAKSKAEKLHGDSIVVDESEVVSDCKSPKKVRFEAFVGVGPRRFFDLFSMRLGSGRYLRRKDGEGNVLNWRLEDGVLRRQMLPYSYLDLETAAARHFSKFQIGKEERGGEHEQQDQGS
jgi:deoxycytidylate deaminase